MIRSAVPGDLETIVGLERSCLGVDAWSPGLVAEGLAGGLPTVSYLVATTGDDHVVGHAVIAVTGDIAELQRIAVAADQRRAGRASRLLEEVTALGRREGADRLLLEVRADNGGALAFYAARGFVEIDRRARYYTDGTDALVMRLPLVKGCG